MNIAPDLMHGQDYFNCRSPCLLKLKYEGH